MLVNGTPTRTIWVTEETPATVRVIDQRSLPHAFITEDLRTAADAARAIADMLVRGAPLIGVTAAYGIWLSLHEAAAKGLHGPALQAYLKNTGDVLKATRPTAVNLAWAVEVMLGELAGVAALADAQTTARATADRMAEEDVVRNRTIGEHGLLLLESLSLKKKGAPVQVLTHCNAGWLGCVDYGTATSPLYLAHKAGIKLHVWVDETRPKLQGANLTAWELSQHGIPHTVITDNMGGLLMMRGDVDICIVGSDRTTRNGDTANKIGTYLKALAAHDNNVPFYVAVPGPSFDPSIDDAIRQIPIEARSPDEVHFVYGWLDDKLQRVRITPENSPALNYGFDITPARLITGIITERGLVRPVREALERMYPEFLEVALRG